MGGLSKRRYSIGGALAALLLAVTPALAHIRLKTTPSDLRPIKQVRQVRFDGKRYVLFTDVLASE